MPKVMVCYKWVADEADIIINNDRSVDMGRAKGKISDYDKNAIEAAVRLAADLGWPCVGISCGDGSVKQSVKDALSRGPEAGIRIEGSGEAVADAAVTARALAAVIRQDPEIKAVILAEGSSDNYARQTGPRLAALLDWPVVSCAAAIQAAGETLTVRRRLEEGQETVAVDLPAVLAVLPEINPAPIPGLKAVLAAGKKPVTLFKLEELDIDRQPVQQIQELKAFTSERKQVIFDEGDSAARAEQLIGALRREGVI